MKSISLFVIIFVFILHKSYGALEPTSANTAKIEEVAEQTEINIQVPLQLLLNEKEECPRLQELGKKLLNDQEFCDLHLEVIDPRTNESRIFCAHKSILCLRSEAMKKKVRDLLRTHTGPGKPVLKVPNMDPDVFKNVLRYIYIDKIDSYFDLKRNIMDLYVIADYMGLSGLMKMIEEYLRKKVHIRDIIVYLRWAKKFKLEKMRLFILDFARIALGMSQTDWNLFIEDLCISAGYHRPLYSGVLSASNLGTDGTSTTHRP